jgi:hypothetical protein
MLDFANNRGDNMNVTDSICTHKYGKNLSKRELELMGKLPLVKNFFSWSHEYRVKTNVKLHPINETCSIKKWKWKTSISWKQSA